jgi:H+/Cl- antiporter ClcA
MVGCGAAAAIAGAFGAPLAGAFYAFELVIGGYTPASLTPVGVAAVTGYFVAHAFTVLSFGVAVGPVVDVLGSDLAIAALLGIPAALFGIARDAPLCGGIRAAAARGNWRGLIRTLRFFPASAGSEQLPASAYRESWSSSR